MTPHDSDTHKLSPALGQKSLHDACIYPSCSSKAQNPWLRNLLQLSHVTHRTKRTECVGQFDHSTSIALFPRQLSRRVTLLLRSIYSMRLDLFSVIGGPCKTLRYAVTLTRMRSASMASCGCALQDSESNGHISFGSVCQLPQLLSCYSCSVAKIQKFKTLCTTIAPFIVEVVEHCHGDLQLSMP
jgi:hypothetical protein